jgi:hypothetical protein
VLVVFTLHAGLYVLCSTLRLGRDLPHGFFGLYGIERSATEIIDESAEFLAAQAQD